MSPPYCLVCGIDLPARSGRGRPALYCSAHRRAADDLATIVRTSGGLPMIWRRGIAAALRRAAAEILEAPGAGHLRDYRTGRLLRPATAEEAAASREAATVDGGSGVIRVGDLACYVEAP